MSSSACYDSAVRFLLEDIYEAIEAEQPGVLSASSIVVARAARGSWPRRTHPPAISVEIVPRGETPVKAIGIGQDEIGQVFDLVCNVRKTAKSEGDTLLDLAEDLARALAHRYRLRSDFELTGLASFFGVFFPRPFFTSPFFGTGGAVAARFLRTDAKRIELDPDPEASNRSRAVTRVTFNFAEARATAIA